MVQATFGSEFGWFHAVHAYTGPTSTMLATVSQAKELLIWSAGASVTIVQCSTLIRGVVLDDGIPLLAFSPHPLAEYCVGSLIYAVATRSGTLML